MVDYNDHAWRQEVIRLAIDSRQIQLAYIALKTGIQDKHRGTKEITGKTLNRSFDSTTLIQKLGDGMINFCVRLYNRAGDSNRKE